MITTPLLKNNRLRKFMILVGISCIMSLSPTARAISQGDKKVTLSLSNVPLSSVFKSIENQTGLFFMYNTNQVKDFYRVTVNVKDALLNDVLKTLLTPKGIVWEYRVKTVVLKPEKVAAVSMLPTPDSASTNSISGQVKDQNDAPLPGAFIMVKATKKGTVSNEKGQFTLNNVPNGAVLLITYTGYVPKQISADGHSPIKVKLDIADNRLDEAVVMAYGTTSRRLNTGSIGKVTAAEIARQPVSNPLAALEGRIPGVLITQSSGMPGASFKVQVRGQSSLTNGSEPLFIVDGIPFAPNNNNINYISSALSTEDGGLSPFSMINPNDIESIEVLKDADATAIYGSRGANGVVLITTKKSKAGKTTLNATVNTGFSKATRMPEMMNTQQYISMRREAFKNDGLTPSADPASPGYAPDLMIWDTTRYTDVQKLLFGGTAKSINASLSLSGGNEYTTFMIGGSLRRETTVAPSDLSDNKSSINFNLNHTTVNRKFNLSFSSLINFDNNRLIGSSMLNMLIPPNFPGLYDSTGRLKWEEGGASYDNPIADFQRKYAANTNNYLSNITLSYQIIDGLTIRNSMGYNLMTIKETNILPMSSFNPLTNPTGTAMFATTNYKSWTIEPQIEYTRSLLNGKLNVLVGGTWQENKNDRFYIAGNGYTSDNLLGTISAAPNILSKSSEQTKYRYQAIFSRINYVYNNKYILNLTGRRDGSSRFGPGNRFSDFGAVGLGWIFTGETFISQLLPMLSFGKIRGSYGVTGNDQIGDYKYLPTWTTSAVNSYQGGFAVRPDNLFNSAFNWERNKKLEVALELGLWKDRFLLTTAYFENKSDNQLVSYYLPGQTGFSSITKNLPALIVNKGIEFDLNLKLLTTRDLKWNVGGNLTLSGNKLVNFPGLENSPYAYTYELGKSVNVIKLYKSTGIDPKTGTYTFDDYKKDNTMNLDDYQDIGKTNPDYYGGVSTELTYKSFQLNVLFTFRKQFGKNFQYPIFMQQYYPGLMYNQPTAVLDRWQSDGDNKTFQKYSASFDSPAYEQAGLYATSSGVYGDASFIRLKNISLSYLMPENFLKTIKLKSCKLFIQAQNVLTITDYIGDPETKNIYATPPLKTIAGGLQLTL